MERWDVHGVCWEVGWSLPLIRWSLMMAGHVAAGSGDEALGGEVGVWGGCACDPDRAKKCWGEEVRMSGKAT